MSLLFRVLCQLSVHLLGILTSYITDAGLPPWWPKFNPRSSHVGFMVDNFALGQVSHYITCSIFINPVIGVCSIDTNSVFK
jgi:hypothetical protein